MGEVPVKSTFKMCNKNPCLQETADTGSCVSALFLDGSIYAQIFRILYVLRFGSVIMLMV